MMDLKELSNIRSKRHPWETARLKAIRQLLIPYLFEGMKVLDVGCGDGFVSRNLFSHFRNTEITAVDIHLSDELISGLGNLSPRIEYRREMPEDGDYDLILLLDVVEHIEYDQTFLADLVGKYISRNGKVIISVPAFQSIYGRHDIFLGHYRRYSLKELTQLAAACGLHILSSGYLFFSLLLPKFLLYKLFNANKSPEGVGRWNKGNGITSFIENILNIDNGLLISSGRLGIKIPGLTAWVLCEKQR